MRGRGCELFDADGRRWLDLCAGVAVSDISVRGASLDDVFLTLTGHTAETESQQAKNEARNKDKEKEAAA